MPQPYRHTALASPYLCQQNGVKESCCSIRAVVQLQLSKQLLHGLMVGLVYQQRDHWVIPHGTQVLLQLGVELAVGIGVVAEEEEGVVAGLPRGHGFHCL